MYAHCMHISRFCCVADCVLNAGVCGRVFGVLAVWLLCAELVWYGFPAHTSLVFSVNWLQLFAVDDVCVGAMCCCWLIDVWR